MGFRCLSVRKLMGSGRPVFWTGLPHLIRPEGWKILGGVEWREKRLRDAGGLALASVVRGPDPQGTLSGRMPTSVEMSWLYAGDEICRTTPIGVVGIPKNISGDLMLFLSKGNASRETLPGKSSCHWHKKILLN